MALLSLIYSLGIVLKCFRALEQLGLRTPLWGKLPTIRTVVSGSDLKFLGIDKIAPLG